MIKPVIPIYVDGITIPPTTRKYYTVKNIQKAVMKHLLDVNSPLSPRKLKCFKKVTENDNRGNTIIELSIEMGILIEK